MSKISELSDGGALQSTDYLIAVRSGGNVKVQANGAASFTTLTASGDVNFDSGTFFVDASADAVGIGTSSPDRPVHLKSTGTRNYIKAETTTGSVSNEAGFDIKTPITNTIIGALGGGTPYTYFYDLANGYGNLLKLHTAETGAVFNDDGNNLDFRVESDGNANMLFVDASEDHVCIGTTSDFGGTLNVNGGAVFDDADTLDPDTMGAGRIGIGTIADGGPFGGPAIGWGGSSGNTAAIAAVSGVLYLGTGNKSSANNLGTRLQLSNTECVFNDDGNDQDFRVESDSNAHALFVDAGNNRVGIGESSPSQALDVNGNVLADRFMTATGTTGSLATSGTADILNLAGASGLWQVSVRNSDGGINWRNSSQVFFNGVSSSSIQTSDSANVTVTMSGTNLRLTNTSGTTIALTWSVTRLL